MNIHQISIATASSMFFLIAGPAHAAGSHWDYKNYAGAGCLSQLAADAGLLDRGTNLIQHSGGPRERPVRVMCPIVRDNVLPSKSIDASVTATPGVDCTFFSADMTGRIVAAVAVSSYEDLASGVRKHYFVLSEKQIPFDGSFAIRCTMNPGQGVFAYNVGELSETTDLGT